ncbi:hypothetical protein ABZP36_017193 [Zizania latifolia]
MCKRRRHAGHGGGSYMGVNIMRATTQKIKENRRAAFTPSPQRAALTLRRLSTAPSLPGLRATAVQPPRHNGSASGRSSGHPLCGSASGRRSLVPPRFVSSTAPRPRLRLRHSAASPPASCRPRTVPSGICACAPCSSPPPRQTVPPPSNR